MKKTLCLVLTVLIALTGSCAALATEANALDYTVAGKLLKQLWAGSGFSGTLQAELTAAEGAAQPGLITKKPLNVNWDYIFVHEDGLIKEQQRLDLALTEGENVQTAAHFQLVGHTLNFQSDLVGEEWLTLGLPNLSAASPAEGAEATVDQTLSAGIGGSLEQLGVPGAAALLLPVLLNDGSQNESLKPILEEYLTRMDLWIEGYRQSTVIGKLDNGTATMALHYSIAPANIKAQLKQLLLSLLADPSVIARLEDQFGADTLAPYLNQQLQPYYFAVIDALALEGDLTIDRVVSLRGSTLSLRLSLPFRDVNSGNMTLSYERVLGDDGLFTYTFAAESDVRSIRLTCLEYSSMTDVTVYQGTLSSIPAGAGNAANGDAATEPKPVALAYTLRSQRIEGHNDADQDTCRYDVQLSLSQDTENGPEGMLPFEDLDVALDATFASKTLKNAATEINATLTVSGEKRARALRLTLYGKTRKQWTPADVPAEMVAVGDMTQKQIQELIGSVAINAVPLLFPYVDLTGGSTEPAPETSASPIGTDAPTATDASASPAATETTAPTATSKPAPTAAPTFVPTATATATATPTVTAAPTATATPTVSAQP